MKWTKQLRLTGRFIGVCLVMLLGLRGVSLAQEPARGTSLSMADIVKQATQQSAAKHHIEALADGHARVPSPLQTIEALAGPEGIIVTSTNKDKPGNFAIRAAALGRTGSDAVPVRPGTVSADKELARIVHPELIEELTTSAEGVRQDFVIPTAPQGSGDLSLELAFSGITLQQEGQDIALTLPEGRKLLYRRLQVTDSAGKTLPARFELLDSSRLHIVVADAGASYPLRIDPTITDSNWVSIELPGTNGTIYALVSDGTNLYAGGTFTFIGGISANFIAKWNGSAWSPLGSGMNGIVYALAWDGTSLYAGGDFTTAGEGDANHIAKWNGSAWSPLGDGMDNRVSALAWDGTNLYAGGIFTTAGGGGANRIATWNGSAWSPLGSGMNNRVSALAWDGTNLYAGGWFTTAGGGGANYIATWNGSAWSPLGSGMNDIVFALEWDGTNLYAGGNFTSAGGSSANYIATWNGSAWSPLGSGMDGYVYALAWDGTNLYAGGLFTTAGGSGANRIAKWNGSAWSPLGDGMNNIVYALAWDGTNLYAGGTFTTAGGSSANSIAKWNGSAWSSLLGSGMNGNVFALAWDGTNLYAGGSFTAAGGISANSIAKWNGSAWSPLGSGMSGAAVTALAWDGTNLYAGGTFSAAGGGSANFIAKWDGSAWSPLGDGMNNIVRALASDGTNLYAGGSFTTAGGSSANYIAKWDGSAWSPLGSGISGAAVTALAWDGTNLYAGGTFSAAGGGSANYIAKWDGSAWSPLGSGMNGGITALAWDGTNLYAGGGFTTAGGGSANHIAKWNGSAWSPLGDGMDNRVSALAWDGTNLYAGGEFTTAGGSSANHIAQWNGSAWSPLGSGMNGSVYALAWGGTNLYAGGPFTIAGGKSAAVAYLTLIVPDAPTIGTATAGNAQATVSFTAPALDGGSAITGYTVTSSPAGGIDSNAGSTSLSHVITGLTNGTAYTFTVKATNSAGTGNASGASNSVTPQGGQTITFANPGNRNFGTMPTLTATASSGLTVSFTSSTTGVCTITSGGALTFVTTGTCTINAGQTGNTAYLAAAPVSRSFNVVAVVPGAPAIGTAIAGNAQATVSFTAPAFNGGSAITGYTVTSSPAGGHDSNAGSTSLSHVITGLTNGTAYTFTVKATNSAGTGNALGASNSVTPKGSQTISFAAPGKRNFGTTPTLTATASSGLTVSFTSSTTGVCTITSGGALTFVTTGTCTINAGQTGNTAYLAAAPVSRSFSVVAVVPSAIASAATNVTATGFTANWGTVAGATGYRLVVATNNTFTSLVSGYSNKNVGNVTSFAVSGLKAGTAYYYRVQAYNASGVSVYSNTISKRTIPAAPTAKAATSVTATGFTANWGTVAGATGYRLAVATNSTFTSLVSGYSNKGVGNVTSFAVSGLKAGTTYYYRVKAYNASGVSVYSNTISKRTILAAPIATIPATSVATAASAAKSGPALMLSTLADGTITNASTLNISGVLTTSDGITNGATTSLNVGKDGSFAHQVDLGQGIPRSQLQRLTSPGIRRPFSGTS